uniref:C2H2-type domain-containing protein n=1 Tax=Ciona savignyi TaxID=51511 RepID=H2YXE0_CIOSA
MLIDYGITHQKLLALRDCISVLKKFPQALLDEELIFLREWIIIDMQGTIDPTKILSEENNDGAYDCIEINIKPELSVEPYQLNEDSTSDALNEYIDFDGAVIHFESNESSPTNSIGNICVSGYNNNTNTIEHFEPEIKNEGDSQEDAVDLENTDIVDLFNSSEIKLENLDAENNFMCSICGRFYSKKIYLQKHMKQHSEDLACPICGKELVTKEGMKTHMLGHKGIKNYTCEICAKSFVSKKTLSVHQNLHSVNRPICTICHREFTQERSLLRHIKNVHEHEKRFSCQICGKCFGQSGELKSHMRVHDGSTECKDCNETFPDLKAFRRHRRFMHFDYPAKTISCKLCDKKFSNERTLQNHVKCIHDKKNTFVCETCGKSFAYKATLKMHVAVHSDNKDGVAKTTQKKFKCDTCGKEMWTHIGLRDHISAAHHGKKNYKCEQCGKEFAFRGSLMIHRDVHLNIRKYKCNICARAFKRIGTLHTHKRTHTGEKPYKCTECKSAFAQQSTLNSHMVCQHTKEYPHLCLLCGKGFMKPNELTRHMEIKH